MIRIAIQSKGRLSEDSLALMREAGIKIDELKRKFLARAAGFPLEVLYLRDDDIPGVVASGSADLGIVGLNEVAETGADVVVVRNYARESYNIDLITYAISGDYMYALVNDPDGHTYIQVYDQNDKLMAEQQVSRKYCKMEIDPENGGCWIMKKRDKDPLLFLYTEDGQLFIYEADK